MMSLLADTTSPALHIPESIQAIVYLVGMVGFPVVVALFVLIRLQDKLKSVDNRLGELSDRIAERPMGTERTTDFIIYVCKSLQTDLVAGFRTLVDRELDLSADRSREGVSRCLSVIKRETAGYLRPIFREHQRFASRFPSVGGNLGSMFTLAAPSEDVSAGETEARLVGQTFKDPAEALLAVLMNNIVSFGNPAIKSLARDKAVPAAIAKMLGMDIPDTDDSGPTMAHPDTSIGVNAGDHAAERMEVIPKEQFYRLSIDGMETVCTILRDSMLEQVRKNTSEFEEKTQELREKRRA